MPSDSTNADQSKKFRINAALTATPSKNKALDAVYVELNVQSNNTTSADKDRLDRANIG